MKITDRIVDRTAFAARVHGYLKWHFERFFHSAGYLMQPTSPVKGLVLRPVLDMDYFEVSFLGMRIRFQFVLQCASDGFLGGKVIAVRESYGLPNCDGNVGGFMFDAQGFTDFDDSMSGGRLDIGYGAAEIILHFFDQAIIKRCL